MSQRKSASRPTGRANPAAGNPPANTPQQPSPTGPDLTNPNSAAAWPSTPPVLGGVGWDTPPSGVDSEPPQDIPEGIVLTDDALDYRTPFTVGQLSQAGPVAPPGSVQLPSGQAPQATTSERGPSAPFVPGGPIAASGAITNIRPPRRR